MIENFQILNTTELHDHMLITVFQFILIKDFLFCHGYVEF
jgi:hypothetical protein